MKIWTIEMVSDCQVLNDFIAGLTTAEQWMVDLFAHLELRLPIDVVVQPDWITLIEICATAPFVPVGANENEFIIGMEKLRRPRTAFMSYTLFNHLVQEIALLPNTSGLCTKCGRSLPSIRLVNTPLACVPRCT